MDDACREEESVVASPFSLRVASADELPKERDESSWTFGAKGMSR